MYEYCCLKYCCCDIVLFGSVAFSTFAVETVVACNTIAVAADVVAVVHYWRGICWCGWRALGSSIHYRRVKARYSAFSKWNIIHILISSWARTMDIGQSRVKSDLALFCDFRNWTCTLLPIRYFFRSSIPKNRQVWVLRLWVQTLLLRLVLCLLTLLVFPG